MAAKAKKTTAKNKKAAVKSSKKAKPAAKSSKPKKELKKIAAPKKPAKKTSAKASSKVVKKASAKGTSKKSTAKPKKGFLTQIVSKLTASKKPVEKNKSQKNPIKVANSSVKENPIKVKTQKVKIEKMVKTTIPKKVSDDSKPSQKNIAELTQEFADKKITAASEVLLTDAEGRVLCRFSGCDEIANVEGYCRYHYLLNWKRIQLKKKILSEGKLEKYINELTAKYPDKYIDMLKNDLKTEKDFLSVVNELEIDDSDSSMSDDEEDNFIEAEVQGVSGKRSSDEDY